MTSENVAGAVPGRAGLTRRGALVVPVAAAGGVALTGCGGDGAGSGGGSASAGPLEVPAADVPVGGGVVRDGVVVTQPAEGEFHAFDASCPHQGCAVNKVEGSSIVCPCHGSTFDTTSGDATAGPAQQGLSPKGVAVSGDTLTVT